METSASYEVRSAPSPYPASHGLRRTVVKASPGLLYPCIATLGLTPARKPWPRLKTDSGFLNLA